MKKYIKAEEPSNIFFHSLSNKIERNQNPTEGNYKKLPRYVLTVTCIEKKWL